MEAPAQSRIDSLLSPEERRIWTIYADPRYSGLDRAIRLSIQYAIGSGIFVWICLNEQEPLWVLAVYAIFLVFMTIRLIGAKRITGVMPAIIAKYEARIAELEGSQPR
jgi:hypothetical protein